MALENMGNFHRERMTLWKQATFLLGFSFVIFVCCVIFIALAGHYYFGYVPGDAVWMLVVSLLTMIWLGYFIRNESLAKNTDYRPNTIVLSVSIIFSILWFTSSVSLAAFSSVLWYGGIVGAIAIADVFAWLSFVGFVFFSLQIYGIGSGLQVWSWGNPNNQQYAMQPNYQQVPYPQQQGSFPQQQGGFPQQQGGFPQQQPYSPQTMHTSPPVQQLQPYSPQPGFQPTPQMSPQPYPPQPVYQGAPPNQ